MIMKYIRKILILLLVVLFFVALLICLGMVYSVKNVNITYEKYSDNANREYQLVESTLNGYKGRNILAVSEEEVTEMVNGNDVAGGSLLRLVSFEKVMPCTLNIVVKERVESFAYQNGESFTIYDEDGIVLTEGSSNRLNKLDGSPDVLISGDVPEAEKSAQICADISKSFGSLRALISEIVFEQSDIYTNNTMTIKLYSGLSVVLFDWTGGTAEKIALAAEKYGELSDSQKLSGTIRCQEVLGSVTTYSAIYVAA
jgi:cell division septal protein FtsQ